MLSLTGSDKKKEDGNRPINRKDQKQAKIFSKGVNRFLNYNKDLLSEDKISQITALRNEFVESSTDSSKLRKDLDTMSKNISEICKKAVPDFQPSLIKENIEVLFVAVVIAMGIRAYFIQQFKIPTGSMQPTLNGVIAYPAPEIKSKEVLYKAPEDYKKPNPVTKWIDSIWFGRSHVEWRAKEDGDIFSSNQSSGNPFLVIFPRGSITTQKGHRYTASGTKERVPNLLDRRLEGTPMKKGDIFARGYLETGDMLIVNKFIYHWRKPQRSDVFVFHTRDITGIRHDPRFGSQHYIKRLCGVPGDQLRIESPNLFVNGKLATEEGIKRVMSKEGLYDGYHDRGYQVYHTEFKLGEEEYVALGDNSGNSLDSRSWGTVPERNIVGKAMFVFYPFGNHFGPIN